MNSEMPRTPGRRVGRARQHQVHDVLGQVVLAVGDEDLLAGDGSGRRSLTARRLSCARSEPACGSVRFMRPGPFAGDHLRAGRSLFCSAEPWWWMASIAPWFRRAPGRSPCWPPATSPAPWRRAATACPGRQTPGRRAANSSRRRRIPGRCRLKPGRAHHAVLDAWRRPVAVAVERRQAVAGKLGRLFQDGVDRIVGGVLVAGQARRRCPGPATSRSAKRMSASGAV